MILLSLNENERNVIGLRISLKSVTVSFFSFPVSQDAFKPSILPLVKDVPGIKHSTLARAFLPRSNNKEAAASKIDTDNLTAGRD